MTPKSINVSDKIRHRPVVKHTYGRKRYTDSDRSSSPTRSSDIEIDFCSRKRRLSCGIHPLAHTGHLTPSSSPVNVHTTPKRRLNLSLENPLLSSPCARRKKRLKNEQLQPARKRYEQLFLDFNQKSMAPVTCLECGLSYNPGTGEDDILHARHHKAVMGQMDYPVYKGENVVKRLADGRVVLVSSHSNFHERKKAREILAVVNAQLNSVELGEDQLAGAKIYLYISQKQVHGCVVAESITKANRIVATKAPGSENMEVSQVGELRQEDDVEDDSATFCSPEAEPAVCGISRIWVARPYRRKGIATMLLDIVRSTFVYGWQLVPSQIAFSQPTSDGRRFAVKYTGVHDFLVYNN
ncbi:uncharacterized protein VTP21DRAFT_2778 [Calcarisporiella thermophila]|uniref:uncharacterized protein n=1 Tax=Calcarisporiella thermophila TaxID=911321 RepID=UPI0037443660